MSCKEHNLKGNARGYGVVTLDGRNHGVHRVAYAVHHNVPVDTLEGQVVRHTCDNPRCINPEHLLLGSHQDNMDDMKQRGRSGKIAGSDHVNAVLTDDDVLYIREHYSFRSKIYSGRALASKFGVDTSTISRVVNGVTWHDVDLEPTANARREAVKARDLDRRTKRQNKRSQCY